MLSQDDRYTDAHKFYQGMQNIAYISGVLRRPNGRRFYIQQDNYANHMIPIDLRGNDVMPAQCKEEFIPVKATCRIVGFVDEATKERMVGLQLLALDRANILDMPPVDSFLKPIPEGVPEDSFKPSEYGVSKSRTSNQVFVAGFVRSVHIERSHNPNDERRTLVILLQQTGNEDQALHLRYKGKFSDKIKDSIKPGNALAFQGEIKIKVKPVGEPDGEGKQPSLLVPYIEVGVPYLVTRQTIKETPQWARDLAVRSGLIKARQPVADTTQQNVEQGQAPATAPAATAEFDLSSIG